MSVTHQDNVLRTESLTELSTEDLAKRANDAAADVRDFGAATSAGTILQRALNDDEIVHDGAYADALAGQCKLSTQPSSPSFREIFSTETGVSQASSTRDRFIDELRHS